MEKNIKELTKLLLYLTSWDEPGFDNGETIFRSMKEHSEEILTELHQDGSIYHSKGAKSITFSETGLEEAKQLVEKYLG